MDEAYAKIAGAWKTIDNGYSKVSGEWKEFYSALPPAPLDMFVAAGGRTAATLTSGNGGGVSVSIGQYTMSPGYRFNVTVGAADNNSQIVSLNNLASNTGGTLIDLVATSNSTTTQYKENDVLTTYSRGSATRTATFTYEGRTSSGGYRTGDGYDYVVPVSPTIPAAGAGGNGGTYNLGWTISTTTCGSTPAGFVCGIRAFRTISSNGSTSGGSGRTSFSGDSVGLGSSGTFYTSSTSMNTWNGSYIDFLFGNYVGNFNAPANSGGGGRGSTGNTAQGLGGSGRVEIRYPDTYPELTNPGTGILTTADGFHIYRFNSSTTITV
jgi:hypothetical protein